MCCVLFVQIDAMLDPKTRIAWVVATLRGLVTRVNLYFSYEP